MRAFRSAWPAVFLCAATAASGQYAREVVVPPGPFHGVHGLAFGSAGELYAGEILGMTVHRIDTLRGSHEPVVGPPLGMADDVAIAPPGSLFAGTLVWSGVFTGTLHARAPDGAVRLVAEGWPGVNTVVFSPAGELYATQLGPGGRALWRVDLSGAGQHRRLLGADGGLNGSVIAADGALYGPRGDMGAVVRLDLETLRPQVIADGFRWPTAVKMDSHGLLYVVDSDAGTVSRVDPASGGKSVVATIEPGIDNLAIDRRDHLFVSSVVRNGIVEIDAATGKVRDVVRGALTAPGGIAVLHGPKPRVFIADMFTLREVSPVTGAVRNLTLPGKSGPYPTAVTAFEEGGAVRVLYTSWFTGELAILDPDSGKVLRDIKGLASPHGAVRLPDGTVIVAETGTGQLTAVGADDTRRVVGPRLESPVGLALAGAARLLVTDAAAGRLVAVDLDSGRSVVVADGLGCPEGVAILPDGRIVIADSARHRVVSIDPSTGVQAEITRNVRFGLAAAGPMPKTGLHNGVAVADDGSIYLPSDTDAALYRLTPARHARQP